MTSVGPVYKSYIVSFYTQPTIGDRLDKSSRMTVMPEIDPGRQLPDDKTHIKTNDITHEVAQDRSTITALTDWKYLQRDVTDWSQQFYALTKIEEARVKNRFNRDVGVGENISLSKDHETHDHSGQVLEGITDRMAADALVYDKGPDFFEKDAMVFITDRVQGAGGAGGATKGAADFPQKQIDDKTAGLDNDAILDEHSQFKDSLFTQADTSVINTIVPEARNALEKVVHAELVIRNSINFDRSWMRENNENSHQNYEFDLKAAMIGRADLNPGLLKVGVRPAEDEFNSGAPKLQRSYYIEPDAVLPNRDFIVDAKDIIRHNQDVAHFNRVPIPIEKPDLGLDWKHTEDFIKPNLVDRHTQTAVGRTAGSGGTGVGSSATAEAGTMDPRWFALDRSAFQFDQEFSSFALNREQITLSSIPEIRTAQRPPFLLDVTENSFDRPITLLDRRKPRAINVGDPEREYEKPYIPPDDAVAMIRSDNPFDYQSHYNKHIVVERFPDGTHDYRELDKIQFHHGAVPNIDPNVKINRIDADSLFGRGMTLDKQVHPVETRDIFSRSKELVFQDRFEDMIQFKPYDSNQNLTDNRGQIIDELVFGWSKGG